MDTNNNFVVCPNARAKRYAVMFWGWGVFVLLLFIEYLADSIKSNSFVGNLFMFFLFLLNTVGMGLLGLSMVWKKIIVKDETITVKKWNKSFDMNVKDITSICLETRRFRLNRDQYLLSIKSDKKMLSLQDVFFDNYSQLETYLFENIDKNVCEIDDYTYYLAERRNRL